MPGRTLVVNPVLHSVTTNLVVCHCSRRIELLCVICSMDPHPESCESGAFLYIWKLISEDS